MTKAVSATSSSSPQRTPDLQYQKLLRLILENGTRAQSQQEVDAITLIGPPPLHYKFSNGFPVLTDRDLEPINKKGKKIKIWQLAIGEILGFINGARTQSELEKFGCNWWKAWVTEAKCHKRGLETGDLGPGSYGAAFHDFPTSEGPTFNQFKHLVEQVKELPHLRTHFVTPWVPQYIGRGKGKQQKVVVAPCHGWLHVRIINNKLTLHMFQRSADVPVGVPSNIAQYAALTLMLAEVTGFEAYEYVHSFSDAHIYVDQVPAVKELLKRHPGPFPIMKMKKRKNLFAYRKEDFELVDYHPEPSISNIPVAI